MIRITLAAALVSLASSAAAQTAPQAAASPRAADQMAQQCELHIWPAERLKGHAFAMGQITGRASGEEIEGAMTDLLDPTAQLGALRELDLMSALGLPADTKLIEHLEPLDRKTVNKVKTRRASSASQCYSELIIVEHKLTEDIVWGDRFQSSFAFRDFGDKAEVRTQVRGKGGNKLKILTLPETDRPADAVELVAAAVRGNFQEFARRVRR